MNILFVTDLCPIDEKEYGLPSTLLNFILDFKSIGHNIVLLRPNVIPNVVLRKRKIYPEGEYDYKGIRCINKNFLTPFFNKNSFEFLKNLNENEFDLILSHMPSGVLAANKIAKILNIPYFASVHASDIEIIKNPLYFFLWYSIKKAYMEAKIVLPRSFWLKKEIEKKFTFLKNKTYVIPSGIERECIIDREKIQKKSLDFFDSPLKIFTAGSLIKRKNFKNLIKAVSCFEDIKLIIAGDGYEKETLKKLVKKLSCEKRVIFKGMVKRDEILNLMEKYPVFILPSLNETFGMVYIEALAKGSVVICTKNSGISGFIKDGVNGFLTECGEKDIIETIKRVKNLKTPAIIMNNALDTAIGLERHKAAENYLNIIQNILV